MTIALWLLVALVYYPASIKLYEQWAFNDTGYSHGFLIVGIVLYLLFEKKEHLKKYHQESNHWFIIPILGLSLFWTLAFLLDIQLLQTISLPVFFVLIAGYLHGFRYGLAVTPIILFLFLAIPIWEILIPSLQTLAVIANEQMLAWIGIPTVIEGVTVRLPSGNIKIAHGCSGLRYLLVSLTMGALYGYLYYSSIFRRIVLLSLSLIIGVAFNWIRIFIIIYIGHKTQMEHSLVEDHETFGWILYAFALIFILTLAHLLTPKKGSATDLQETDTADINNQKESQPKQPSTNWLSPLFLIPCLSLLPLGAYHLTHQELSPPEFYPIHFPYQFEGWAQAPTEKHPSLKALSPHFANTHQSIDANYFNLNNIEQPPVTVSFRGYFVQKQAEELIYYKNNIYNEEIWQTIAKQDLLTTGDNTTLMISGFTLSERQLRLSSHITDHSNIKQTNNRLMWHFYVVNGTPTNDPIVVKLLQLKGLLEQRTDGALITLHTECQENDCSRAREQLSTFLDLMLRQLYQ